MKGKEIKETRSWIKDKILDSMSYNFQIVEKFSLGHAKS